MNILTCTVFTLLYSQFKFCMQYLLIRSACTYDLIHPFSFTWLCHHLFFFFSCLRRLLSVWIEKKTDPFFIYRHMNLLEMSLLGLLLWDTVLCRQRNMKSTFWKDIILWLLPPALPWCVFDVRPSGSSKLKELKEGALMSINVTMIVVK